jgi:hypothetical protein
MLFDFAEQVIPAVDLAKTQQVVFPGPVSTNRQSPLSATMSRFITCMILSRGITGFSVYQVDPRRLFSSAAAAMKI